MSSYIYVIGPSTKPYKIGITNNPKRRLKNLQTGHPNTLFIHHLEEIPDSQVKFIEKTIHILLNNVRTKGEWFNIELKEAIAEVKYARMKHLKD